MSEAQTLLTRCLLLAGGYFVAGRLGLAHPYLGSHITLIWLPSGIAVAALLRWGMGMWPGIFLGSFLVNISIPSATNLALAIATGNTLGPMLSAYLLSRWQFTKSMDQPRDIVALVLAAALGMVISSSGGVLSLYALHSLTGPAIPTALLTWWAGDFVGVLLAAPLLLNVSRAEWGRLWRHKFSFSLWLLCALVVGWGVFVLNNDAQGRSLPLVFLMLPLVVWSAMRFDTTAASLGTLLCMLIAVLATSAGMGPFRQEDPHNGMFVMWVFLATLVLVQLMVAALQTQRRAAEKRYRSLAFFDPLTHLPNRNLLSDRLQHALAASARHHRHGALMMLDLDHFKNLNDIHGHGAGDDMLVEVARRLKACVRAEDTVARLGGDEFVIILEDLDDAADRAIVQAEAVAEKIRTQVSLPYTLNAGLKRSQTRIHYYSTASIGVALFRHRDDNMEETLKRADLTMYQAKAAGRNAVRFFDPKIQATLEQRTHMENHLRQALEHGEIALHYQLQFDQHTRAIGCEALMRWNSPTLGTVSPADFIPLAEDSGLILPLGRWAVEQACQQLHLWSAHAQTQHLSIAVNVSPRQFREASFVPHIADTLQRHGAPAAQLKLELTEGMVFTEVDEAIAKMHELKALGVTISLDDFGTGYSSLKYLQRMPIDQLKIDQSFVRNLTGASHDAAIVRAVITLTHTLGVDVIAEGVETAEQHAYLLAQGCNAFQGYLFAHPQPAQGLELLLAAQRG